MVKLDTSMRGRSFPHPVVDAHGHLHLDYRALLVRVEDRVVRVRPAVGVAVFGRILPKTERIGSGTLRETG